MNHMCRCVLIYNAKQKQGDCDGCGRWSGNLKDGFCIVCYDKFMKKR